MVLCWMGIRELSPRNKGGYVALLMVSPFPVCPCNPIRPPIKSQANHIHLNNVSKDFFGFVHFTSFVVRGGITIVETTHWPLLALKAAIWEVGWDTM